MDTSIGKQVEEAPLGTVPWLRTVAPGGSEWTPAAVEAVTLFALLFHGLERLDRLNEQV